MKRPLQILLWSCSVLFTLTSCSENGTTTTPPAKQVLRVVTTTGMVADLVRAVGGNHVQVSNIIGEGIDPHLYKPNRDDIAQFLTADLVFYNGLLLEGKMGQVLEQVAATKPVIAVTETIPSDQLIYPDDSDDHPDPHVWLDPQIWLQCTSPVVMALVEAQPHNATEFIANSSEYIKTAAELYSYGTKSIQSIPPDNRLLITSHDAFNYFGRAFDIEVLGVQGISTESEAGLTDIEQLVDVIVSRKIPAVFIESSVPPRSVEALIEGAKARGHDVAIGGELFTDAMGPTGTYEGTWPGMIDHDVTTVTRALGGIAPERGLDNMLTQRNEKVDPE